MALPNNVIEKQVERPISIWRNVPLLSFWTGQSISVVGSKIYTYAIAWEVIRITGSTLAMGTVLIANILPMLLFSLFGGVAGDRWPRRNILICSDFLCFFISCIWGITLLTRTPHLIEFYSFAIFVGLTRAFFLPAYRAVLPELVTKKQISRAVSISQILNRGSDIIAPIVSGIMIVFLPFNIIVLVNGVSYGIAFLSNLFLPRQIKSISRPNSSIWSEIHQGWHYFFSQKVLFWSVILITLANIGAVTIEVNLPKFIERNLAWNAEIYGQVIAGFGIGALISYVIFSIWPLHTWRGLIYLISLFFGGLALFSISFVRVPWQLESSLIAIGIAFAITSNISSILLQELTPTQYRSRIMGIVTISSALTPVGYGLWGLAGDLWGNVFVFICAGFIILIVSIIGFMTPLRHAQ